MSLTERVVYQCPYCRADLLIEPPLRVPDSIPLDALPFDVQELVTVSLRAHYEVLDGMLAAAWRLHSCEKLLHRLRARLWTWRHRGAFAKVESRRLAIWDDPSPQWPRTVAERERIMAWYRNTRRRRT